MVAGFAVLVGVAWFAFACLGLLAFVLLGFACVSCVWICMLQLCGLGVHASGVLV